MTGLVIIAVCAAALLWVRPAWGPPRRKTQWWRVRLTWGRRNDPRDAAGLIGAALTSVAARLRAGQSPPQAWRQVAKGMPPTVSRDLRLLMYPMEPYRRAPTPHLPHGNALRAAQAATRLAQDLGAELAPVLEAAAGGIEEAARAHDERQVALAAPRATARLLLALPWAGLAMSALLGAHTWQVLTTSAWGAVVIGAAAALLLTGRWWINLLISQAQREGGQ